MSGRGSKQRRALQFESVKIHGEMRRCDSEDEFQVLQGRSLELYRELGVAQISYSSLQEFKKSLHLPRITPATPVIVETDRQTEQPPASGKENLKSICWYLDRVMGKVTDLGLPEAKEFNEAAEAAKAAIEELVEALPP